ncbi:MAG: AAA family ATPase, partial [Catenulispora sp.]|nr:AAA family ATPase [Catenulispora sp.]
MGGRRSPVGQNGRTAKIATRERGGYARERRPSHVATDHEPTQGILGRKQELARLDLLVADAAENGPKVLVVTGEPGVGKSALVEWTAERGRTRGMRVLRVRGSESEADLCFSAAHQLLRPLLPEVDRLAEPGRGALRSAFGLPDAEAGAVDPLHLRIGVTNLLADAAAKQPLLLLIDDAQWVDAGSLDIVSFVARRLAGQPIVLLVAAREESVPERFDRDFPHLVVEPLDHASAGSVLDAQPHPPRGRMRARILQESAGVPLALIELARAVAGERGADVDPERSLPLTKRLEKLFAADLPAFPPPTRRALLLLAAADTTGWTDIARADPDLEVDAALRPAEGAGLVRVEGGHAHWRHPLVRSAVYQAASFSERRQAHLALAAALTDEPDRRAWHLAAAALGHDEEVAAALAGSAERSQAR